MQIRSLTSVPSTPEFPRNGEGSAVLLKNGKLLVVFGRFSGPADDAKAELSGGCLDPGNGKISGMRIFHPAPGALNQMSVSLERLQDDSIAMVFIRKISAQKDQLFFSKSYDEGDNWTEPVCISNMLSADYFVVNNDRLRQFASGRIALPVCVYPAGTESSAEPSWITLFYSDDNGRSWNFSNPVASCSSPQMPPPASGNLAVWEEIVHSPHREQEPGVEELANGKIFLYCRTKLGYMHYALSEDNGTSWSAFRPAEDMIAPNAPQSIRRIPGTTRLLCLYNDRRGIPFGSEDQHWNWRTPLTLAVSDDHGESWKNLGIIGSEAYNWCYASILFAGDLVLITVYRSENTGAGRRNLANMQMICLEKQDVKP